MIFKPKSNFIQRLIFITILVVVFSNQVKAENNWQCKSQDAENKEWFGQSDYQLAAINKAYELCKKESALPQTCKTSKESCEMMMDGVLSMKPMWRCMALDLAANAWFSNVYDHAGDAVLAALAYCRAYSSIPSTCYIDPYICRDLNARSF